MKYDYLIVGAGLFGACFAREAADAGQSSLIIDKRNHIAGNCYTEYKDGIDVHIYGPHIFHTNSDKVWNFVNRFATFNTFVNRPLARYGDAIFSLPINLYTLNRIWEDVITPEDAKRKLEQVRIKIDNPANLEEWILSRVGQEIYDLFFYGYTKKQWGRNPRDLPASIIKRLPIRTTYDNNYYNAKYQGIPVDGYTKMIENIIDHRLIKVRTGEEFDNCWKTIANSLIYSGSPDRLFHYEFGELEYRSLDFKHETIDTEDYQGNAIVNYTDYYTKFTRIVEHKHFTSANTNKTIITKEYPKAWSRHREAYYPIVDELNISRFNLYKNRALNEGIVLGGRLGTYKYLDMDQVVANAIRTHERQL